MPDTPSTLFKPNRRRGMGLLILAVVAFLFSSILLFVLALQEQYGSYFVLFLVVSLLLLAPAIFTAYRAYALIRAEYRVGRDGVLLQWGLRREEIPLPDIEWVQPAAEVDAALRVPFMALPGGILGTVRNPELGLVEYMAGDTDALILLATRHKTYAISPADPNAFLNAFRRSFEMGSLAPVQPVSSAPATYLRTVFTDPLARWLMIAGLLLSLGLLTLTTLVIPSRNSISLGYNPAGVPLAPVPANQLLLIPILSIAFFILDLVAGFFFYRKEPNRPVAVLLWISALVMQVLLYAALGLLLLR